MTDSEQEERVASVSAQLELSVVEEGLKEALETARSSVATTHVAMENISATESGLDNKIEKRQQDLERNNKRLQMLKKVRSGICRQVKIVVLVKHINRSKYSYKK